jgi:hypothetical protein
MFKHLKCGGQHETVLQARECEATVKFAAETEASHASFLRTGRDEFSNCHVPENLAQMTREEAIASQSRYASREADRLAAQAEAFLKGSTAKLANGHATSPIFASLLSKSAVDKAASDQRENFATPPMERFVSDLIAERETDGLVDVELAEALMDKLDGKRLYYSQARALIEALKVAPKRSEVKAARTEARQGWRALAEKVPDGRYALPTGPGQDKTHFYRVSRRGAYVKLQEQASDSLYEIELKSYAPIFEALIAYGVERSGVLYAKLIGSCRRCGRTLTDENNPYKYAGYGPECGAKI